MLMNVRELLSTSWKAYKKYFKSITVYSILAGLIMFGLAAILLIPITVAVVMRGSAGIVLGITLGLAALVFMIYYMFKLMVGFELRLRHALYNEDSGFFGQTLKEAKPVTLPGIWVSLAVGIIVALPFLIGMIGILSNQESSFLEASQSLDSAEAMAASPLQINGTAGYFFAALALYGLVHMVYFSILYVASYYAVIFDKKTVSESLNWGKSLVQGRWWSVFWRILAPQVIFMIIYFLYQILIGLLGTVGSLGLTLLVGGVGFIFLNFFAVIPLIYMPMILLYEDLKKKPLAKA